MKAISRSNLNTALHAAKAYEKPAIKYTKPDPVEWTLVNPMWDVRSHLNGAPCRAILCAPMPDGTMRREYIGRGPSVLVKTPRRRMTPAIQRHARNALRRELEFVAYEMECGEYTRAELLGIMGARKAERPTLTLTKGA